MTESDLADANQQLQQVKPVGDIHEQDDDDLHFKKTTRSAVEDFIKAIKQFKPHLIAVSCTETTFLRG